MQGDQEAELAKLHRELFPTDEAWREWQRDSERSVNPPPAGTQERQQYDDLQQLDNDDRSKEKPMAENTRGVWAPPPDTRIADLGAEQKAGMDKALAQTNISELRTLPPPQDATGGQVSPSPTPARMPTPASPPSPSAPAQPGVAVDMDKG